MKIIARIFKVYPLIMMFCAIIFIIDDFVAKQTQFIKWYLNANLFVMGVYVLYLAKKRQGLFEVLPNTPFISFRWFAAIAVAGLLLSFYWFHVVQTYPIWIVSLSVGIIALFWVALYAGVKEK